MATARQIAANRANAKLSTGPRSAGGKRTSSQNAKTHGLCTRPESREIKGFLEAIIEPFEIERTTSGSSPVTAASLLLAEAEANLARIRKTEADHATELGSLIEPGRKIEAHRQDAHASRALELLQSFENQTGVFSGAIANMAAEIAHPSSGETNCALARHLEKSEQLQRHRTEAESLRHKRLRELIEIQNPETNPISSLGCKFDE